MQNRKAQKTSLSVANLGVKPEMFIINKCETWPNVKKLNLS